MNTYLAIFLGAKDSPRMAAWMAMPEAERKAKEQEGIAAWKGWMEKHHDVVVGEGGPLGKTKRVSNDGTADVSNLMSGFVVVRAASYPEAIALVNANPFGNGAAMRAPMAR